MKETLLSPSLSTTEELRRTSWTCPHERDSSTLPLLHFWALSFCAQVHLVILTMMETGKCAHQVLSISHVLEGFSMSF